MTEYTTLTGVVSSSVNFSTGAVGITREGDKRYFECYFEKYIRKPNEIKLVKPGIEPGDVITYQGAFRADGGFQVTGILGAQLPTGEYVFSGFVIRAASTKKEKFDVFKATKLYEALKKMGDLEDIKKTPEEMLSYIANCSIIDPSSFIVEKFKSLNYEDSSGMTRAIMSREAADSIICRWIICKDRRILLAMGLTEEEIFTSNYTDYDLLVQLRKNPYVVASIDAHVCEMCDLYNSREILPTDKICHKIKRKLYMDVQMRGWTCTTKRQISSAFPGISQYDEALQNIYEVVVSDVTIYRENDCVSIINNGNAIVDEPQLHPIIGIERVYYIKKMYDVETKLTQAIIERVTDKPYFELGEPLFENEKLDEDQKNAVRQAMNSNFSIITGPAGSGKTTTLRELCKNLDIHGVKYAVTSLTGKAVVRAKEIGGMGERASTMHRMLFGSSQNKEFDYLIIDEATMVNNELMYDFLMMFKHKYPILLIGDVNQLQPISWGSYFSSTINSRSVITTRLTNIHRVITQDGYQDGIIKNSCAIANWPDGEMYVFHKTSNFQTTDCQAVEIGSIVTSLKDIGVDKMKITIICPYVRGYGVTELNQYCQLIWNYGNKMIERPDGTRWIVGDRVMMLKNNYDVDVCNGQEGMIIDVSETNVTVNFPFIKKEADDLVTETEKCRLSHTGTATVEGVVMQSYDKLVIYDFKTDWNRASSRDKDSDTSLDISNITLSYVIGVHKSQGSEWPYVIYYMPSTARTESSFICRPLTYVGITRGSAYVIIAGSPYNAIKSIAKGSPYRCEMLKDRLKHALPRLYNKIIKEFKFDEVEDITGECYEMANDEDNDWMG